MISWRAFAVIVGLFTGVGLAGATTAQILPQPSAENPRIQSIEWAPGQEVILTSLPNTALTVLLEPGEQIRRVSLDRQDQLDVRVSAEGDSLLIMPRVADVAANLAVQSDRRDYNFTVQSARSLTAAYLVKFIYGGAVPEPALPVLAEPTGEVWHYRLKGDREVRPQTIEDDGVRTRITYGAEQALPAVFAIGPTGDEQVINGYMRGNVFVIDRVHRELVFRIDKKKATAKRNREASDDGAR
ncbi:TrbG/VirB9 family P-type conjugative transfer protein [Pontixanthobacter aquaemixtae]|uniref:Type IV secretion system protein virB9 n=1 Tax=Pontixanthobacter aquaemixtae TaxID=1958940 RepID=A0A844ZT29_9SPHN|nr:TrbG/VirB9 family P-type conjugative transfer protein [Pontixanthobacter aquaemixtae]MXO90888.1 hypothetical protein [Pontixanthobacter aquaemixtae]